MKDLKKIEQTEAGYVPILKVKGAGRIDLGVYSTSECAVVLPLGWLVTKWCTLNCRALFCCLLC